MLTTILHPLGGRNVDPTFARPDRLASFTAATEKSGYDAIAFTEHPAPPTAWMETGGHGAFDPLVVLAHCAAHSERLRLMTYLLVLPYRNPFLTLKALTTVDVLSGGRLTVVAGTGYLKGEFAALGVDFEERNALFDETVEVLRTAWGAQDVHAAGLHFTARGQALEPAPVQARLPVWVGGNSRRSRQRAALVADGWSPIVAPSRQASRNRTAAMTTLVQLKDEVDRMRGEAAEAHRDPAGITVQLDVLDGPTGMPLDASMDRFLDFVDQARKAGVDSLLLRPPADDFHRCLESMQRYGEEALPYLG